MIRFRIRRRHIILFLGLIVWASLYREDWVAWGTQTWRSARRHPVSRQDSVGQSYELTENWLTFPVLRRSELVRILTNAALIPPLPRFDRFDVRPGLHYEIEYRIVDRQGTMLESGAVSYRTQISQSELDDGAEDEADEHQLTQPTPSPGVGRRRSFWGDDLILATSRRLRLPVGEYRDQTIRCELRLNAKDHEIQRVVVRVATKIERPNYRHPNSWEELSLWRKERLCQALLYPPELLTVPQQQQLLRWQWLPVAPLGVEGHDYRRHVMLTRQTSLGTWYEPQYVPEGEVYPVGTRRVVRFPETPGRITWSARPYANPLVSKSISANERRAPSPRRAWLDWHNDDNALVETDEVLLPILEDGKLDPITPVRIHRDVVGGWLEYEANSPMSVQVFWQDQNAEYAERELKLETHLTSMFPCGGGRQLRFSLVHGKEEGLPIRLMLGRLEREETTTSDADETGKSGNEPSSVTWSLWDDRQQRLATGEVEIPAGRSSYEFGMYRNQQVAVSQVVEHFWRLPRHVQTLVLETNDEHLFAAVANRPVGSPWKRIVAPLSDTISDSGSCSTSADQETPSSASFSWSPIRPQSFRDMVRQQETLWLHRRDLPPNTAEHIATGNFTWEGFDPIGEWTGRALLIPHQRTMPPRLEGLDSFFVELSRSPQSLEVAGWTSEPIQLQCVLLPMEPESPSEDVRRPQAHQGGSAAKVQLFVDDHVVATFPVVSSYTERPLPRLSPGRHQLYFQGTGVRVLLNHIATGEHGFLRRTAIQNSSSMVTIPIQKNDDDELIVLDYFPRTRLDVTDVATKNETSVDRDSVGRDGVGRDGVDRDGLGPDVMNICLKEASVVGPSLSPELTWSNLSWQFQFPKESFRWNRSRGFVLETSGEQVGARRRSFLRLGPAIPHGNYVLEVECVGPFEGYYLLSQTREGLLPLRRVNGKQAP